MPQLFDAPEFTATGPMLAARVQHTLIASDVTEVRLRAHCEECLQYGFNAAMVSPAWVPIAREVLSGSDVILASAVDFPPGAMATEGKVAAAHALAESGVDQIDMGTNVGFLLSGYDDEYARDIAAVVAAVAPVPVKVMLELPLLTNEIDRLRAVRLSIQAGAAYLKNVSSGAVGVASADDIAFLRREAPLHVKIKASGGIYTRQQITDLLGAGADLVGTSAGAGIFSDHTSAVPTTY